MEFVGEQSKNSRGPSDWNKARRLTRDVRARHAHRSAFDAIDHLTRIARALKPGGLLHIGMKTGQGEARDPIGRFYTYYSDAELTELLRTSGLSVVSRATGREKGLAGTIDPWIILLARKT